MAEYIERQRLKEAILSDCQHLSCFDESFLDMVMNSIDEIPSAPVREDVQDVWISGTETAYGPIGKNGNLIKREIQKFYCRERGRETVIKENFCPHCGARMIGVE